MAFCCHSNQTWFLFHIFSLMPLTAFLNPFYTLEVCGFGFITPLNYLSNFAFDPFYWPWGKSVQVLLSAYSQTLQRRWRPPQPLRADFKTSEGSKTSHRGGLLSEPLWIPLILAVHIHLLGPQGHAAVAVEVEAVVSTNVRPLLLQLPILRLQELRQTRFSPLRPGENTNNAQLSYKQWKNFEPNNCSWTVQLNDMDRHLSALKRGDVYLETSMWVTAVLLTGPLRLKAKPGWLWMSWGLPT